MNLFKKLQKLREEDRAAIERSKAQLEEAERSAPTVNRAHAAAQQQLSKAEEQARRLSTMDRKNHYSESLTQSFRGRPA